MSARVWVARSLALAAAIAGPWVAIDWMMAPRLPEASGGSLQLFPPLAIAINAVLRGAMPAWVGTQHFAVVALTLVLAVTLALRLAWVAPHQVATRRLAQALALASLCVAWFWFLRDMAPWQLRLAAVAPWLDMLGSAAGALSLVALVGCFQVYPEPLTQEFAHRGFEATLDWQGRLALAKREGRGIWRLWAWLPPELYGGHGSALRPELQGLPRLLRSREALWLAAMLLVPAWGLGPGQWFGDEPLPARALFVVVLTLSILILVDPVAQARFDSGPLRWARAGNRSPLVAGELALHRLLGSPGGLAAMAVLAAVVAGMWNSDEPWLPLLAAMAMLCYVLLLFGHAISLLLLNWRHGAPEHRRAIGWICLGTLGATVLWMAAIIVVGLFGLGHWWLGGDSKQALGIAVVMGPPLIALAFVLSLWASTLHRGSFDPSLALRRGTGVALAGILLTALFVALEGMFTSQVVVRLGMPTAGGAVVAGTVTALVIAPLRKRVDRQIERAVSRWLPPEALAASRREQGVVVFSDLSGYTRLSETDEKEALTLAALLHRCARELAARHGGRVVKSLGDAVLCVYANADQALAATTALHRNFRSESAQRDLEQLPVHSGMHAGDWVVAGDGDVFGASVNLAARLQGLAGADEVVASASLAAALQGAGIVAEAMPGRRFKNLAEAMDCFRFRVAG